MKKLINLFIYYTICWFVLLHKRSTFFPTTGIQNKDNKVTCISEMIKKIIIQLINQDNDDQ